MNDRTLYAGAIILIITLLSAGYILGWFFNQPPHTVAQISIGTPTPLDVYPVSFRGGKVTVILGGHYDSSSGIQCDNWIWQRESTQITAPTLYELIQKVYSLENQTT